MSTSRVALVGTPLRRRHSEVMHNAAFARFGIDARYELRPTETGELAVVFLEARGREWLGLQVTAPHKQAAMSLIDEIEPGAEVIGAINTVIRTSTGRLVGLNTDAPGFARSVREDLHMDLSGAVVAVAGAGGAARAVVQVCLNSGASTVSIGNRTQSAAQTLAAGFDDDRVRGAEIGSEFDAALRGADLAVNATTVGMSSAGAAFDVSLLPDHAKVLDLVYTPRSTELVASATARGLAAVNGMGMLVAQAAIAFERWTGVSGAEDVMRQALERLADDTGSEI
ncbi:MAG TPA: shikimate dehydrogenase [Acidimicrobiia bacterium]|nr:shikimate dehydrogenase [Acidimicrobiia bacterium]